MNYDTDTIAAIATAMSNAGIGIIRISGPEAISAVDRIYRGRKPLTEVDSHTVSYGHIVRDGEVIDEVMVLVMRAPRTYTREDTVEIDCHGGVLVERKVLDAVLSCGIRPAEPGEFTKRAFLNGRIDLAQAESVMEVITSENDYALSSSMDQLGGVLSDKIHELREKILYETAYIESALDDPEHYDLDGYPPLLKKRLAPVEEEIRHLIGTSQEGSYLREGIRTAIVGKPNAGKSSLLNALAGRDRAIVTAIPGTTRDTLEEKIILRGITLQLVDTAGIRQTDDEVERIGVRKASESMEDADLIIYVIDSSVQLDENDRHIMESLRNRQAIVLLNKSDLATVVSEEDVRGILTQMYDESRIPAILSISASTQEGLDRLGDLIEEMFFGGALKSNDEIFITSARQKYALEQTFDSLQMVNESIDSGMTEEVYTVDLMNAYEQLGLITGETVGDDLADEIFSRFCMGK